MHLADAFIQSDLQCIQAIHFFVSMCVPWEFLGGSLGVPWFLGFNGMGDIFLTHVGPLSTN